MTGTRFGGSGQLLRQFDFEPRYDAFQRREAIFYCVRLFLGFLAADDTQAFPNADGPGGPGICF